MELYLIRHTTPKVAKGVCYGQTDLDVTNSFEEEFQKINEELGSIKTVTTVYSSPLLRCKLLANKIAISPPIIDDRLMEMNFGDWEMKNWDEINQTELNKWMDDFVNVPCPNGESYALLYQRTSEFIKELKTKQHSKVIISTHGGVIRAILSYINQEPLKDSFETKVNYGDVFKLEI